MGEMGLPREKNMDEVVGSRVGAAGGPFANVVVALRSSCWLLEFSAMMRDLVL